MGCEAVPVPVAAGVFDMDDLKGFNSAASPAAVVFEVGEVLNVDDCVVVTIVVNVDGTADICVVTSAKSACEVVEVDDVVVMYEDDVLVVAGEEDFENVDEEVVFVAGDDVLVAEREVVSSGHVSDQLSVGHVGGGAHNAKPVSQPAMMIFRNIMSDRSEIDYRTAIAGRERTWLTALDRARSPAPRSIYY